jgi:hypothetical protein
MNRASLSSASAAPQAGLPARPATASNPHDPRAPWLQMITAGVISPLAGEPGHRCTGGSADLILSQERNQSQKGCFDMVTRACPVDLRFWFV